MSRSPSSENTSTTSALTTKTATAGLDEDLQPVAAPDRDDAGHPAEEDVGRELERGAVHGPADDRDEGDDERRERRVEQDREQHPDRGRRQEERQDRAAGRELERERRADHQQPDQDQDVVAVPERGPEPPDPGEQHPDDEHREQRTSRRSRDVRASTARGRARRSSRCRASVVARCGRSTSPWRS